MRVGIAAEVEVPDDADPLALTLAPRVVFLIGDGSLAARVIRYEVHPDPEAVFPEVDNGT